MWKMYVELMSFSKHTKFVESLAASMIAEKILAYSESVSEVYSPSDERSRKPSGFHIYTCS